VQALTVSPGEPGLLRVDDVPEPRPGPGELLVTGLAVGVCATDREILAGHIGAPPPGRSRLIHRPDPRASSSVVKEGRREAPDEVDVAGWRSAPG
jgi:threonine dehydrogenase-like Zn-dependent dehydrogenase